ncbi:ABC transporter permease [Bombiscardovia nodaiensis]|uniref:ABC transporter permease n=1 Tax=Bombiscardovia nodaiensis TaxID=2932181 RepID=A0ABN6SAS7_9BIFI|nr:ABC transporter permease [Bombiscardovia nodaiensis]
MSAHTKTRWIGWGFVGPFLIVFFVATIMPICYALYLSVFRDQLIGGSHFVGLSNYISLLKNATFWDGLWRVIRVFLIQVPIMLGLALLAALCIDSGRLKGHGVFRIVLFLPYAVPGVVAVLIWEFLYGNQFGLTANINALLGTGFEPLAKNVILWSIGNIMTWSFLGYNMLILYSGLKTIPTELYEAARLDGASEWKVARYIKIPAIKGQLLITYMFSIIGTFQLFSEPQLLKTPAPNAISSNYTPNLWAYNLSLNGSQYNNAAALAILMGVITGIITYITQEQGSRNSDETKASKAAKASRRKARLAKKGK